MCWKWGVLKFNESGYINVRRKCLYGLFLEFLLFFFNIIIFSMCFMVFFLIFWFLSNVFDCFGILEMLWFVFLFLKGGGEVVGVNVVVYGFIMLFFFVVVMVGVFFEFVFMLKVMFLFGEDGGVGVRSIVVEGRVLVLFI